jgi:DNA-binding winged helix-turn-helix (wHTH) protein/TolB-like protein/Flp pilus assembly protein TadD
MATNSAPVHDLPDEFSLGAWRVRPAEGVLLGAGRQVRLEPKVAALLAYLARRRDRMVSKEELLSAVWSEATVAPVALSRAISELRRALGDDPKVPRYIETYPKRGYRLVAAVGEAHSPAPPPDARPRARLVLRAALVAVAVLTIGSQARIQHAADDRPVVLVEPFRSLGTDTESRQFAAGLTEDVLAQLSRLDDMRVLETARAASVRLEASATRLEGTVRRADGHLRIVARLVARESGAQLWSEAFDRDLGRALDVQRDVAVRVVHGMRVHGLRRYPPPGPGRASGVERQPDAYDLFRAGHNVLARRDLKGVLTAQEAFERALRLDPDFALGRTGLALALAMRTTLTGDRAHAHLGLREARRVVEAAPDLPEGHHAEGRNDVVLHRFTAALKAVDEALRLQPDFLLPLWDRSTILAQQGETDRALQAVRDLYERDYPSWRGSVRSRLGVRLLELGLDDEARHWLEAALRVEPQAEPASEALAALDIYAGDRGAARRRLSEWVDADPSSRSSRLTLGWLDLLDGDAAEARRQAEHALALPGEPTLARLLLATVEVQSGHRNRAEPLLHEVEGLSRAAMNDGSEWWGDPWALAAVAALRNDPRGAADWYGKAVQAGRRDTRWDRLEPAFANVRRFPAFVAHLEEAEARVLRMRGRIAALPPPPVQEAECDRRALSTTS